jgi:predicted nucleotide-binding protein (sugar kinase/HSP70/actin superfamily)
MGNLWVAFNAAFKELNIDVIYPPPTSKRTLSLGVRYSPETICLPFKITLGNFIEAIELGADKLLMVGGRGLCRFGYYPRLQEMILRDLGYEFEMLPTDLFKGRIFQLLKLLKDLSGASMPKTFQATRFGIAKLGTMDDIEKVVLEVRAREEKKGTATRVFRESIAAIDEASNFSSLKRVKKDYIEKLRSIPTIPNFEPLKVGLMGEFYVVLEPFANMDVEVELGKLGVEVERSLFISNWTKFSLILTLFGFSEKKKFHKAAMPYLKRDVGGDGWESVGEKVFYANEYDGLVHVAPFTCLPEIVAQNILPSVKEDIPVLTLTFDEQMGKAGMLTRLEAFVDLLKRRREQKQRKI